MFLTRSKGSPGWGCLLRLSKKYRFSKKRCGTCSFLVPAKKGTKESGIGEALLINAPSPMYLSRRFHLRPPKMFRFSGDCCVKSCRFLSGRWSKIGTFLATGWRCGGGGSKGDMHFRNVPLSHLLLVLFLVSKKSTSSLCFLKLCTFLTRSRGTLLYEVCLWLSKNPSGAYSA